MTDLPVIRPAVAHDLPDLLGLYAHLTVDEPPCPPERAEVQFAKLLALDGTTVLLGCIGAQPVTSCVVIITPNLTRGGASFALIENVVTHADFRGRGFGTQILDAATDLAQAEGCYKIMLMTGSKRPSTLAFYESAGFAQTKTAFQKRFLPPREA